MPFIRRLQIAIINTGNATHLYEELIKKTRKPLYKELIELAEKDKEIQYQLLQYVYYMLTGEYFSFEKERKAYHAAFKEDLKTALRAELNEAAFFRDLLMDTPEWRVHSPICMVMNYAPVNAVRFASICKALK